MNNKKEQRPDAVEDGGKVVSNIGLDNPDYHYRIVGRDSRLKDFDRVGKHKDLGYKVVKENERTVVMACKKEDYEARQAKNAQHAENLLKKSAQPVNDGSGETMSRNTFALEQGVGNDD